MTLFRKGLIPWTTHAMVYSACLVLSAYHILTLQSMPAMFVLKVGLAFAARVRYRQVLQTT